MIVVDPIPGMRLIESVNALKQTTERLFPFSRHRSKRVRKKLMKRFGGEFRMRPCSFIMGDTIIAHPEIVRHLREHIKERVDAHIENVLCAGPAPAFQPSGGGRQGPREDHGAGDRPRPLISHSLVAIGPVRRVPWLNSDIT